MFWILIPVALILVLKKPLEEKIEVKIPSWTQFDDLYKKWGAHYGIPWQWLKAIALNESNNGRASSVAHGLANPTDIEESKSSDGLSWGLMQVTIKTARGMDPSATEAKLNNPDYSVMLGARYLSELQKMFPLADPRYNEWVIKSYNQGPGNTNKERRGEINGYANEYWSRFQRNLLRVEENT